MKHIPSLAALCFAALAAPAASAFDIGDNVQVHGSVQSDILFPEDDAKIGTEPTSDDVLTNTYADINVLSKYIDGGLRFEYLEHPMPGFNQPGFKGWGVPHIYLKGKYKNFELTGGDFYDQFGSGFIFRTYEKRALGIDSSIRGGRLKYNSGNGIRATVLGGVQRHYWYWSTRTGVWGADAEVDLNNFIPSMAAKDMSWMVGASYVLKSGRENNQDIAGTDYMLNLPDKVSAFDVRTQYRVGGFSVLGEYAWKSQDPSVYNQDPFFTAPQPNPSSPLPVNYMYNTGSAALLSLNYSKSGLSAMVQAKRSDNMAYGTEPWSDNQLAGMLNNMPAFAYLHTYALNSLYAYSTNAAGGEWAFEGMFSYNFKRKTPLGGKYGTKVKVNASYIRGVDKTFELTTVPGSSIQTYQGTTYKSKFFKFGDTYYQDYNVQLEKKVTRDFSFNFMYMYQQYNKTAIEGHGGNIYSHIFTFDGKYKISKKVNARMELQYLTTQQDQKDWAYGLIEVSVLPYLMFTVSDMWNCGDTGTHYYMGAITGNYKANRLMVSYGRTRAGFNCAGGVCRYVPATRGFQISYNYSF